jgi:hypothetical protein
MITNEQIETLNALQAKQNDGRGVECVRHIVLYLKRNDERSAKAVWSLDGDKIRQYPELEKYIIELFGCRTHFVHNCQNWLCK